MKRMAGLLAVMLLLFSVGAVPVFAQTNTSETEVASADLSGSVYQFGAYSKGAALRHYYSQYASAEDTAGARNAIVNGLENRAGTIDLTAYNVSISRVASLFADVINNYPRFFYVASQYRYQYSSQTSTVTYLIPSYDSSYTSAEIASYESAVKTALQCVNGQMSEVEKALALHDYLAELCKYDYTYTRYNAYNALVEKTAVCQGYTLAYEDLLQRSGITTTPVTSNQMNHIWNALYLDGSWYNVDVTWDSPNVPGGVRHSNFLLSDTALTATHSGWDDDSITCSDTRYDNGAMWQNLGYSAVIFPKDETCYYIKGDGSASYLIARQGLSGAETILDTFPETQEATTVTLGGYLYYNRGSSEVYQYNPIKDVTRLVYTLARDGYYLSGVSIRSGGINAVASGTGSNYLLMPIAADFPAAGYTGLYHDSLTGLWFYYVNGEISDYTGMAANSAGWWYVKDGVLDWTYTGIATNTAGTWYMKNGALDWSASGLLPSGSDYYEVSGGKVQTDHTGMAVDSTLGWCYVTNGKLDTSYTGMAANSAGWWYMTAGRLDWTYTGIAANTAGTWYMKNGKLDWSASGLLPSGSDYYEVSGGKVQTGHTGMAVDSTLGWCYVTNGKLDTGYTGMAVNAAGWWYISSGRLNWKYTGIASNQAGTWYMKNGKLDWSANGLLPSGSDYYEVSGGKVQTDHTGMAVDSTLGWCYVTNGKLDTGYTGIAANKNGTWYFTKGKLDWSAGGLLPSGSDYYEVSGGKVQTDYTGMLVDSALGWCYVTNGKLDTSYTGMAANSAGWWYIRSGRLDWNYTGIADNGAGTWYMKNGALDWSANGLLPSGTDYYYVISGQVQTAFSGNVTQDGQDYAVVLGKVTTQ